MQTILKNKTTGKYFGHLNLNYTSPIDYDNIKHAYKFDKFVDLFEKYYYNIPYEKELRLLKFKKLFNE